MNRLLLTGLLALMTVLGYAQFVWPKPEYHAAEPGLYKEDPFIVKYRQRFFAVFRGDFKTFEEAYAEIKNLVRKNPKDARALVWLGNGHTVKAGLLKTQGRLQDGRDLLKESRIALDKAVSIRPKDPNIYMMRAATLFIQGQYWPEQDIPTQVWANLRDDCLKFIDYVGPKRMPRTSIHLRGEAYGELGVAYQKLGQIELARRAFQKVIELCPGTAYEERAKRELATP
jgi:tetratricopeptide (TPR) repeat protein